jgi:hypothetical protein
MCFRCACVDAVFVVRVLCLGSCGDGVWWRCGACAAADNMDGLVFILGRAPFLPLFLFPKGFKLCDDASDQRSVSKRERRCSPFSSQPQPSPFYFY